MISAIYHAVVFDPLYNAIMFLADTLPFLDAGLIVVVFTIIIRFALFPLSKKSVRTQVLMRSAQGEINEIKKRFPNREEQARKVMGFYKEKGINPFASIVFLFIQIPILIALYRIFYFHGLTDINTGVLYSFIQAPESIPQTFLGLLGISDKSYILAVLAGASQYLQAKLVTPKTEKPKEGSPKNFADDLARTMNMQVMYVLPIIIAFGAYHGGAAIGIYWITSTVFTIVQELVVRKQLKKEGVV